MPNRHFNSHPPLAAAFKRKWARWVLNGALHDFRLSVLAAVAWEGVYREPASRSLNSTGMKGYGLIYMADKDPPVSTSFALRIELLVRNTAFIRFFFPLFLQAMLQISTQ